MSYHRSRRYTPSVINSSKSEIINDLLKPRPVGPDSSVHISYVIKPVCVGVNDSGIACFRDLAVPAEAKSVYFNYTIEQLYNLGLHSYNDCEKYFAYNTEARTTITRRSRLLWTRIKGAVEQFKKNGQQGIYKIVRAWSVIGHVFAVSSEEARQLVMTTLAYSHPDLHNGKALTIEYISNGTAADLVKWNAKVIDTWRSDINSNMKRIEDANTQIMMRQNQIDALLTLQNQQIAIACIDNMNTTENI